MNTKRPHPLAAGSLVAGLACLVLASVTAPAGAQCGYTALVDRTPVTVATSPAFYTVDQSRAFWMAVAVKPPSGADWDISVWQDTYAYPGCVTTLLAGSALGYGVDFVVGDFNYNPAGTRYVEVNRYSGTGDATLEWSATDGLLSINEPLRTVAFGAPIHIFDVYLLAGTSYAFTLQRTAPADIHLLLFRNEMGGTCWKRRQDAEWDVTASTTYTAPSTGYYGLVVVKDDWAVGDARIRVSACTTPEALTSGGAAISGLSENYFSFDQPAGNWTALGVRGSDYWDLEVYRSNPGSPIGTCFSDAITGVSPTSTMAGVVVGDFNVTAPGTYFARARYPIDWYTGQAIVEWDDGPDELTVNAMLTHGTMSGIDVVRAWDVYLEAGRTYHFTFGPSGADLELLLFRNPGASEYWAGRTSAVLATSTDADYTAPASGRYGVVIVNDDGGEGAFTLGVGTCAAPIALGGRTPYTTALGENYVQFTQDMNYWTVIGVRGSDPATDWDMVVQSGATAEPFPVCRSPQLAVSDQGPPTVDFVVGDFNHNTPGTYHAWPHTYFGEGSGTGTVLWDWPRGLLWQNEPSVSFATDQQSFLRVWDVQLTAGVEYAFVCWASASGSRLLLFRNPASGTYWAPRSSAEFEVSVPGGGTGVQQTYVAPVTDWYGVVVVNDGGLESQCFLRVGACAAPAALSAGHVVNTGHLDSYFSIGQNTPYWTVIGVRGSDPATDWDLVVQSGSTAEPFPVCRSPQLAVSDQGPPIVDFVVGDFNHNPYGTYYLWGSQRYDPGAVGSVEWDSGADAIVVGGPAVERTTGPDDVLEAWDCWLEPQKFYTFNFTHTGTADLKLLIFRNPSGGVYWAPREEAEAVLPATATRKTRGTAGEYYGLVVVNDNGGTGTYSLQVIDPGAADVEESPPVPTALTGARPNPSRGGVGIAFSLRSAATVAFQVLDLTGRQVALVPARACEAGRGTATWDGRGDGGARLPAGLYFVRMTAGERVVGTTRVTLLD